MLGLRPAPEFEAWLQRMGVFNGTGQLAKALPAVFEKVVQQLP